MKYRQLSLEESKRRTGYFFLVPSLLLIACISLFPFVTTLVYSFQDIRLNIPSIGRPFVGFKHYLYLFGKDRFLQALVRTIIFTITFVSLQLVLGLCVSMVLNMEFKGRTVIRIFILIPWAMAYVITALMWSWMYSPNVGIINNILLHTGIINEPIDLLGLGKYNIVYVSILVVDVWRNTPFVSLILLAGLQGIPEEIYESARIDGAGRFSRFRLITLPLLKHAILVALLFRSINAIRAFDIIYVMTRGGPGTSTEILSIYGYFEMFKALNFGRGSAISISTALLTTILCLLYMRVLYRD